MSNDCFARPFGFRNNFHIRCAGHANIRHVTTNMTALFQRRGHVAMYVHIEQKVHPATVAGMGNTLSSIVHEAYASA